MSAETKKSSNIPKQFMPKMPAGIFAEAMKNLYTKPFLPKLPTIDTSLFRTIDLQKKVFESILAKSNIASMAQSINNFNNTIAGPLSQLHNSLNQINDFAQIATGRLKGFEKIASGIVEAFRKTALSSIRISDSINKSFQVLKDLPELWIENRNQLNLWLFKMGWPPLLHVVAGFPYKLKAKCKGMNETKAKGYVDKMIVRYHTEDVLRKSILKGWEKRTCMRRRFHLLRPAVEAHIRGEYALSVPTILPQLEGTVAENFGHKGFMGSNKHKKYLKNLLRKSGRENSEEVLLRFISDVILTRFQHGVPIISDLSRHAILHGGDIAYDNVCTSLKVILVLDLITSEFEFVALAGSSKYHKPGCSKLKYSKKERTFYTYDFQAESEGRLPCKFCITKTGNH